MSDNTYSLSLAAFDSGEARQKLRGATEVILTLENDYAKAIKSAAESESYYRLRLSEQFKAHRDNGAPAEAAKVMAHGECANEKRATLEAAGELKLAAEKLEDARDMRRSLWRLVEWSRDKELATLKSGPAQQSMDASPAWPR